MKAHKNIEEGIRDMVSRASSSIRFYVKEGFNFESAASMVRGGSCLGPKTWQEVMDSVSDLAKA